MDGLSSDLIDLLLHASHDYADLLADYCQLTRCEELDDEAADRLATIYTAAAEDPLLNFFINEFDYIFAQRLGLLDQKLVEHYKDQQAWLTEHLEHMPLDQRFCEDVQRLLKEKGFYSGLLDGIWGKRSERAVKKFRKEVQRLLQQQGLYDGPIDGELGQRSTHAVMAFQKSQHLKGDGVPDFRTFSALQSE